MSSSELSSSLKHKWMKAFLTQSSASDSHSLINIALLESLGILEGYFCMQWVSSTTKKKIPFCYFECFGVVKVARFGLVKPEVFKIKYFCFQKKISMIDRTLTILENRYFLKDLRLLYFNFLYHYNPQLFWLYFSGQRRYHQFG